MQHHIGPFRSLLSTAVVAVGLGIWVRLLVCASQAKSFELPPGVLHPDTLKPFAMPGVVKQTAAPPTNAPAPARPFATAASQATPASKGAGDIIKTHPPLAAAGIAAPSRAISWEASAQAAGFEPKQSRDGGIMRHGCRSESQATPVRPGKSKEAPGKGSLFRCAIRLATAIFTQVFAQKLGSDAQAFQAAAAR